MSVDTFIDVENRTITAQQIDTAIADVGSLQIGEGSRVFRGDQSGIWLGASKWADAPFRVDMSGNLTASSAIFTGYVEDLGGQYDSAASGARVRILPTADIGIQVIDDSSNNVFLAEVGGANVGDVTIGDYAGGDGVKWDKSASTLLIRGDMNAGSIDGVTITGGTMTSTTFKTAASGARVEIAAADQKISIYDAGNDEVFYIDDEGGFISIKAPDSRDMNIEPDGNLYFDAYCRLTDDSGIGWTNVRSSALSDDDWQMAAYKSGGAYGFVARMDGGNWNFAMNAGVPT